MSKKFFLPEFLCEIDSEMDLEKLSTHYHNKSSVVGKVTRLDFENQLCIVDLGGQITATMSFENSTIYQIYKTDSTFSINITELFEKTIQAKIIVFENNNIVLSRKENMLEAIESFKNETESIFAIVTGFSRMSAFMDIGAGIIGRSYSKNFCNTIFQNATDVGIKKDDMISVKIIGFEEDAKKFELSRVDALPNFDDFLNKSDVVNCKVFTPIGDGVGYYVLIDTVFCGIVDSPEVKLDYGDIIQALIKNMSSKGPRLNFIRKVKKN